jgi:hypothetical protein
VKNAYIHDGSGWQSLKGPPGPSEPSKDAGNTLTVGSDGLLMLKGDTQFSGSFTPGGSVGVGSPDGHWSRTGRVVTVLVQFGVDAVPAGEIAIYGIDLLPFSIAQFYDENFSVDSAQFAAPLVHTTAGVVGFATVAPPDQISVKGTGLYEAGRVTFTLTYLTDDARIG